MHGIAGSPDHFRTLLPLEELIPADWSVYNVLMDGNGKGVKEFSRSYTKKWTTQVMGIFNDLCETHERVIIVGHSMGTLFAVQMALRRPEKVPFIFLIACPLRVGGEALWRGKSDQAELWPAGQLRPHTGSDRESQQHYPDVEKLGVYRLAATIGGTDSGDALHSGTGFRFKGEVHRVSIKV